MSEPRSPSPPPDSGKIPFPNFPDAIEAGTSSSTPRHKSAKAKINTQDESELNSQMFKFLMAFSEKELQKDIAPTPIVTKTTTTHHQKAVADFANYCITAWESIPSTLFPIFSSQVMQLNLQFQKHNISVPEPTATPPEPDAEEPYIPTNIIRLSSQETDDGSPNNTQISLKLSQNTQLPPETQETDTDVNYIQPSGQISATVSAELLQSILSSGASLSFNTQTEEVNRDPQTGTEDNETQMDSESQSMI